MFWFNRMAEHWVVPQRLDLVEHVRRGRLQVVQTGTFGPQFYGLADDPEVDRQWVGMPLVGVSANLDYIAELIPRLQEAGARVVGQMSMSWHYGDHEEGKGLFGVWDRIWKEELPGEPPCDDPVLAQQLVAGGQLRQWPIEGRPYRTYSGCMCNPHWLATLKAMLGRAIDVGVDGINLHHNFEVLCPCSFCSQYLMAWLGERFGEGDLTALFGTADLGDLGGVTPREEAPPELKQRYALELQRVAQHRRKEAFDEILIEHGRQLKPDLLLAQWYHKYDFGPSDERSLLPAHLWAREEDFIWYSQGAHQANSSIRHGHLADMGLPARFAYAAGAGRPFILNKYDTRRWRLSIAEAAANHGAALAFHWGQDGDADFDLEDYCGPVFRYQRFLEEQHGLIHPARPWSQIGLVYPRRGELAADGGCTDALRRVGRLLEDGHYLFDIALDEQLEERASEYEMLILPDVARLSDGELAALQAMADRGGHLLCTGDTGALDLDGDPRKPSLRERANASWIGEVPPVGDTFELRPGAIIPKIPALEEDAFGQHFLRQVGELLSCSWLETDAPWHVRVRAWLPAGESALVLHWVNYHQDEDAEVEVPWPEGPIQVRCALPSNSTVERVEWLYPEMGSARTLEHSERDGLVAFAIPQLIVYGMSVIYFE